MLMSWSQAKIGRIGGKQIGFMDYELNTDKKLIKCETFLVEIKAVVLWQVFSI
jgi:hypothetical protein